MNGYEASGPHATSVRVREGDSDCANRSSSADPSTAPGEAVDDTPLLPGRWLMIGLAFLATVINYLDRQTLSMVADVLGRQFHMNNETYGLVLAAFMLAYTVMNGVSGPLLDRLGTRLGYGVHGLVVHGRYAARPGPRAVEPGVFRFLLGMGEAGNWPAAVKVVAEWFPQRQRGWPRAFSTAGPRWAPFCPPG